MDLDALRYWMSVGLRRSPILVASLLVSAFAGIALIALLPPVYRSAATILLEPPQIAPDLARSTVPPDTLTQVAAIQGEIFARDNLLALADRFDIYGERASKSDADIVGDLREAIRIEFVKVGATQDAAGAATFSVAFEHRNPAKAAAVVDHLVSVILDENAKRREDRAGETLAFFVQEVASLGAALSKAEGDILRFKNENIGALPDSLDFRYTQWSSAQERLVQLEREEAGLRSRRETLLTNGRAADSTAWSARDQELLELRRLLEQRLAVFAPTSPSVLDVKERIAALERPMAASAAEGDDKLPGELRIKLDDIDGRLEFIDQERGRITKTLGELEASIANTPGNETELNRLMRIYESARASYIAAVQRRADAAIGAEIEKHLKGERLTLLEEPVVPEKPIRPQRLKIAVASVAAGLGLGCGIVLLLELLDGRLRRPAQLVHRLGLEPVVTIPYIDAPRDHMARRIQALGLGLAAAGASAAVLVAVHVTIMPLGAAAQRLLQAVGLPIAG